MKALLQSVLVMLACSFAAAAQDATAPSAHSWDKHTVALLASLPIQDGGRVKPLDTYAQFKLLKFCGKRTCTGPEGKRIAPLEWLLDTLFYPEVAQDYVVFNIDNSESIVALGLQPHEKKRDRYSYRELLPARDKLFDLAEAYARIPEKDRSIIQRQIINLAQSLMEFEAILEYANFAQRPISPETIKMLPDFFPLNVQPRLADVLKQAGPIQERYFALRHDTSAASDKQRAETRAISSLFADLDTIRDSAKGLALFPPAVHGDKEWLTPADMITRAFETEKGKELADADLDLMGSFEDMVLARDDPARFQEKAAVFHAHIKGLAQERGEYGNTELEVAFYRWHLFSRSLELYVLGFMLLSISWLVPRSRLVAGASTGVVVASTLSLVAGITLRCIIRGRPPATTLYETIIFTTATIVAVALFVEYFTRQRIAFSVGTILAVIGMFLANKYEARDGVDTMPSMAAVLDTNFWLATHVTTVSVGYAAGLLAGAMGHVYILGRLLGLKKGEPAFYETLTRMVYGIFCFGFFFTLIGTLLGGIWANESWGRFWGWDPKENGALLIVLWQLAVLHARVGGHIRDLGLCAAAVVCGMVVAFSWWGVNLLGVGLHSYGFTSGTMNSLIVFWTLETAVICLGAIVWARQVRTTT